MASTRLCVWMKDAIISRLLQHAFSVQVLDLINDQGVFARRVFDDVVKPGEQVRLGELPPGWVPEVEQITVKMKEGASVEQLNLNGYYGIYGELSQALAQGDRESVATINRRCPYRVKGGVCAVYSVGDPLQVAHEDLENRAKTLRGQVTDAEKVMRGTLDSFSTVNALIKGWPEVEPFASRYIDRPSTQLPVVPRARLNAMLDLPVETAQ